LSISVETAYRAVVGKLGFIVICWRFDSKYRIFEKGDPVYKIWGTFPAPEDLRVAGRANRREWDSQSKILLAVGLPHIPPVLPGWRLSKVVPVNVVRSEAVQDEAQQKAKTK
jgi:hypothetical protein